MHISLNIATGGHVPFSSGLILPWLASGPAVSGDGREATTLVADASDTWTYDGAQASVAQRQYRLMLDGIEVVPATSTAALEVPPGSAGGQFWMQLRVQVTEAPDLWSPWQIIASGIVTGLPQLSGASAAPVGETGYSGTVTTDTGAGTLYWMVSTSPTPPAIGPLKAANSQPITEPGAQAVSGGTLSAATAYHLHFVQEDAAGQDSAIVSSPVFTTNAPQVGEPAAFGPGDWSITNLGTGGDARLSITALPDDGGDALKVIFYNVDGGPWTPLPSAATGSHDLMDLFTDGVPATLRLRSENIFGPSPDSAPKSVTTTSPQPWQITDTGDGRFTLSSAPPPDAAPQITNNGDGTFAVQA